jgi:RNA polymerase sigma factor (sigma-70 family)
MSKKSETYSDEEILEGIRTSDRKVLEYIYRRYFKVVKNFVINKSGSEFAAWDVFQDGIYILYDKIQSGQLELTSAFQTFFVAICKHVWTEYRRDKNNKEIVDINLGELDIFSVDENESKALKKSNLLFKLMHKYLNELSPECQKMLRLISENYTGSEIVKEMNYGSVSFVYNKRQRCFRKLLEMIKNDTEYKTNIGENNEKL